MLPYVGVTLTKGPQTGPQATTYCDQSGSERTEVVPNATDQRGARGTNGSSQPISCRSRSALRWLQRTHAATTFVHSCRPPRERGCTWSTVSAPPPQYAHRWLSRCSTVRRVGGTGRRTGTCT